MVQAIPGAAASLNDLLMMGTGKIDLQKKRGRMLVRMQQVWYFSFIRGKGVRRPDPENPQALKAMPRPTAVSRYDPFWE